MRNYIGNNNEINKKKYKKSLPPKLNPDAGNVEHNIDMFNKASSGDANLSSAAGMNGMAESYDRDSLIARITEFGKHYNFDKYTDAQLNAMLNRLVDASNHKKKVLPKHQDRINVQSARHVMNDDPSYNFNDSEREGEYRVENLREALNRLDHYCIDNDKTFYDLRSLYEGIKYQLKPEEKQELKRLVDTTNDPDAVRAYIDSKDPNRKRLLQSKGIMEEIDDDELNESMIKEELNATDFVDWMWENFPEWQYADEESFGDDIVQITFFNKNSKYNKKNDDYTTLLAELDKQGIESYYLSQSNHLLQVTLKEYDTTTFDDSDVEFTDFDFDESLNEAVDADGWEKPYSWTAMIRKDNFILEPRDPYKDEDNDSWHVSQIVRNSKNKYKHHGNFNSKQAAKEYVDKILDKRLKPKIAKATWTDETDVDFDESLNEDTVKQGNKWVNKGKEGTHGKFKTKKAADAQRKAMFANGYKGESLQEDISDDKYSEVQVGDTVYHKDYGEGTVEKFNYKSTPSQEDTIYVTFSKDLYGDKLVRNVTRIFPFPRAFQTRWLRWLNHPDSIALNDSDIQYTDVNFDESLKLKESSPVNYKKKISLIREIDRGIPYSMRYKEADIVDTVNIANGYDNDELILYWVTEDPFTKDELQEFAFHATECCHDMYDDIMQIALTYRGISKGFNSDDNLNKLIWIDAAGEWTDEDWDHYVENLKKVGVDVQANDLIAADWEDSTDFDFDESLKLKKKRR